MSLRVHLGRLATAVVASTGLAFAQSPEGAPAPPALLINEVDSDTPLLPVNDSAEFIEFLSPTPNASLVGYTVVFFNGNATGTPSQQRAYFALNLTGSTDANGYYLIGNVFVVPTPSQTFAVNFLQNGADAVALYLNAPAALWNTTSANGTPVGSPPAGAILVDAVVYDTNDADEPVLIAALTPGQPQIDENGSGSSDLRSIGRCGDGAGGALVTTAYRPMVPTPKASNLCPANDDCAGAVEIFDGVNPGAPLGADGSTFTNVGSAPSSGYLFPTSSWPDAAPAVSAIGCPTAYGDAPDVWFKYVATCEAVTVSTCTPSGFASLGTITNTVLHVLDGCAGALVACSDDTQANGCTQHASAQFAATVGATYYIRVRSTGSFAGTFYLHVRRGAALEDAVGSPGTPPDVNPLIRPRMTGTPPILGGSGTLFGAQFAANSPAHVFYSDCGAGATDFSVLWPGLIGYLDLGSIQLLTTTTTDASGRFALTGALPTDPGLTCLSVCFQTVCTPMSGTPTFQFSSLMTMTFAAP